MSSAPSAAARFSIRALAWAGWAGLAALTLPGRSATRMHATPWVWLLVATCLAPPVLLLCRLRSREDEFRFPTAGWAALAAAVIVLPVLSALASPYRPASLLLAGLPAAAGCVFLLTADWLARVPEASRQLKSGLAIGAAIVTGTSTFYWLLDVRVKAQGGTLASDFFAMRNPHPLGHSNYTAGLMLLGLPWLVHAAWRERGWKRIAAIAGAGLALLALGTSGSRGGILGLLALSAAAAGLSEANWRRWWPAAVAGLALTAGVLALHPRVRGGGRIDPPAMPDSSITQRTAMLHGGWLMGCDRPLLGWGPGTTPLVYPRYRHALAGSSENALQLHNTPVQIWAETGGLGLLAAGVAAALVIRHRRRAPLAAATLAGYGVFALTDQQLDVPVFAAGLALLGGMLAPSSATAAPARTRMLFAAGVCAVVTLIIGFGRRDPTPEWNVEALQAGRDPTQHTRAVALLRASLERNPDQEIAHFNLGWLLLVPDPAAAERHFRAAVRLVPDKGGVYFGLGLARLNQGDREGAARALAIECINDPRFLASPWWTVPEIAALRDAARTEFVSLLAPLNGNGHRLMTWHHRQADALAGLASRLGSVSPGPERSYRRERTAYPVLMRNSDLPAPLDLYDVREDPRFPATVPFPLPPKGWLSGPVLLSLLDAPAGKAQ